MKKIGILFCSTILALSLAIACLHGVSPVLAAPADPDAPAAKPTISIENGTFESSSNGWTSAYGGSYSTGSFGSSLTLSRRQSSLTGLGFTEDEAKTVEIPTNDSLGENVLFLHNKVSSIYKFTSGTISIPARTFVQITLDVLTCDFADETHGAYVRLGSDLKDVAFGPINTKGEWKTVTLFVRGHDFKTLSTAISLQLGDEAVEGTDSVNKAVVGWAAFDNVTADTLTEIGFNEQFERVFGKGVTHDYLTDGTTVKTADALSKSFVPETYPSETLSEFRNTDFAAEWEPLEENNLSASPRSVAAWTDVTLDEDDDPVGNPNAPVSVGDDEILTMIGLPGANAYGGVKSLKTIPVPRFSYLRVSVWVNAAALQSGTVTVQATVVGGDDETTSTNADLDTSASVTSFTAQNTANYTGDWGEAVILVKGSAFYDREIGITLQAGSSSAPFVGVVSFDRVTYQTIVGADYASFDKGATLEMKGAAVSETVTNGNFNSVGDADADAALLPATDWTVTGGDDESRVHGITALDKSFFSALQTKEPALASVALPQDAPENNAFLLLHKEETTSVLTSPTIASTASTSNRVSLRLINGLTAGALKVRLYVDDIVAVEKTVPVGSQTAFAPCELSVRLGTATPSLKLEIVLGDADEKALGYVWVDTVIFRSDDAAADVDYTGDLFDFVNDNGDKIMTNRAWTTVGNDLEGVAPADVGFVRMKNHTPSEAYSWLEELFESAESEYGLVIRAKDDPTYVGLRQRVATTYTASEFVRIALRVKTRGFAEGEGARIELNGDNLFKAVNSEYLTDTELGEAGVAAQVVDGKYTGWRTYTFFVNVGATDGLSTNLVVRIGSGENESARAKGTILIDSIKVDTISEADYDEAVEAIDKDAGNQMSVLLSESSEEEETTPTPTVDNTGCSDTALWLVPTLLLAVAIIVTVIGVAIRKIAARPRKHKVKGTATYDRRNTVKIVSARDNVPARPAPTSDEPADETPDEPADAEGGESADDVPETTDETADEPAAETAADEPATDETAPEAPTSDTPADKPKDFDTFDD